MFFEHSLCSACGKPLAFLPDLRGLAALEPVPGEPEAFAIVGGPSEGYRYRLCGNGADHGACNWGVPQSEPDRLCRSCRLNEMVPDLSNDHDRRAWLAIEVAKRLLGPPREPRRRHFRFQGRVR